MSYFPNTLMPKEWIHVICEKYHLSQQQINRDLKSESSIHLYRRKRLTELGQERDKSVIKYME